jgi:uncharacterized protein YdcH (DUF465 family)
MSEAMASERLVELEARHRQLHDEVNELERRTFLTPDERRQITVLKKQKLQAKDALYAARRASDPNLAANIVCFASKTDAPQEP